MTERIEQILKTKKLTATQFSEEIGIQRSSLSHILKGRNKPSLDFMLKIKDRYPEIRLNWLLLGEGKMTDADEVTKKEASYLSKDKKAEMDFPAEQRSEVASSGEELMQDEYPSFSQAGSPLAGGEIESLIALYKDGSFKIFKSRK
jgi:transcriptional regulator with XRE-family HTH domain